MNSKSLTILLAAILLLSVFLPYVNFMGFVSISGWDIVLDNKGNNFIRAMIILVAVSALLLIVFALNGEKYFIPRKLLVWIPVLSVIAGIVYILTNFMRYSSGDRLVSGAGDMLSLVGAGFWITLIVAILLPVLKVKHASPDTPGGLY